MVLGKANNLISQQSYSGLDRLIHRMAFSSRAVQLTAADLEKVLFGNSFRDIPVEKPVFITSLPRAGTTLLLEIIGRASDFASHSYRDMPFVLAPMLWDTLSKRFRKGATFRERAHGDGMLVSYDSLEAFEEVLWRALRPERFGGRTISVWSAEDDETGEFEESFREHIQKVIAVRSGDQARRKRYVSKNNNNIARVDFLRRMFPDALIVVPFREPVDQARSLLRQHLRFAEMHRQDSFAKRYMKDIGHFEFGELHRPIQFPGLDDMLERFQPNSLDYWLGYWIVAFTKIINHKNDLVFVSYEDLCYGKDAALTALGERLGCDNPGELQTARGLLRPPTQYDATGHTPDQNLRDRAAALHSRLQDLSVV